jgi:transcriptional/translational regulatory protein YebC/TACO1
MSIVLDAGATDMKNDPEEENYEIITEPEDIEKVKSAIEAKRIPIAMAETMLPKNYINLDEKTGEQMTRLMESLEDHDDVQNVYANFNTPEESVAKEVTL